MRVRLIFENIEKGATVPFHHQYYLYRLFRGLITKCGDETLVNFKKYTFSGLKGQTKISKSGLHFFSNKITLVFACDDKLFVDSIIKSIFSYEVLKVRNLSLKPLTVELEPDIDFQEEMSFICISPIVLLHPKFSDESAKQFIHPLSEEFQRLLIESIAEKMEDESLKSEISFKPDKTYTERIEAQGKKYSRIYPLYDQDVPFEVRGYTLPFTLQAPVVVQKHIFNNGLGLFNDKGFGMADITNVAPGTESTTYFDGQFSS